MGVESESEEKIRKKSKGKKLAMSSDLKNQKKSIFFEFSDRVFSMPKKFFRNFFSLPVYNAKNLRKFISYRFFTPQGRLWEKMSLKASESVLAKLCASDCKNFFVVIYFLYTFYRTSLLSSIRDPVFSQ